MTKAELIEELGKKEKLFPSAYEPTSSPDDAIIGNALRLGACGCLLKPIEDLSLLEIAVVKAIEQTR